MARPMPTRCLSCSILNARTTCSAAAAAVVAVAVESIVVDFVDVDAAVDSSGLGCVIRSVVGRLLGADLARQASRTWRANCNNSDTFVAAAAVVVVVVVVVGARSCSIGDDCC